MEDWDLVVSTPSAVVSDALEQLGVLPHVLHGLSPLALDGPGTTFAGRAVTLQFSRTGSAEPAALRANHLLRRSGPGDVIVMATDASPYAFWGEHMVTIAQQECLAGSITDAGARDVAAIAATGFPVFTAHATPATYLGYYDLVAYDEPVTLRGVTIAPGDAVIGDRDGVVRVPAARIGEVARLIERLGELERFVGRAIAERRSVDEVYAESKRLRAALRA
jgi:4-hydroxy-4-methyl-2-oxoglutarate aldolase